MTDMLLPAKSNYDKTVALQEDFSKLTRENEMIAYIWMGVALALAVAMGISGTMGQGKLSGLFLATFAVAVAATFIFFDFVEQARASEQKVAALLEEQSEMAEGV